MYSFQLLFLFLISCQTQNSFSLLLNPATKLSQFKNYKDIKKPPGYFAILCQISAMEPPVLVHFPQQPPRHCLQIIFHYHFPASIPSTGNWNMVFIWGDIDKFGHVIHGWPTLLLLLFGQDTSAQQIALLSSHADWKEETKFWALPALSLSRLGQ